MDASPMMQSYLQSQFSGLIQSIELTLKTVPENKDKEISSLGRISTMLKYFK